MTQLPQKLKERAARKTAKRDDKKRQMADSTIAALKELGYANTTLRDIAQKSDLSLGMLHYYFEDKSDLIVFCVERYKQAFIDNMIAAVAEARNREQVIALLSGALATAISDDGATHRLWYDIRTQAMFDRSFAPVVAEIEAAMIEVLAGAYSRAGLAVPLDIAVGYASLDGVSRYFIQRQGGPQADGRDDMQAVFAAMLARMM